MALANVACILAAQQERVKGRPVLIVDWDLEAPGLQRFFRREFKNSFGPRENIETAMDEKEGLIDFFSRVNERTQSFGVGLDSQSQQEAQSLLDEIKPESYALRTDIPSLSLLKAGRKEGYSTRVN